MTEASAPPRRKRDIFVRTGAALAAALSFAFGMYLLLEAVEPRGGLVSFTFLILLPAALSGFVAFVADPWRERSLKNYLMIPVWLLLAVIGASAIFLMEGVVCILLLSPLWLASGLAGAALTYKIRNRAGDGRVYCSTMLLVPLLAMQIEPMIPLPLATTGVTRTIVVEATPETLWPLLLGIPDVRAGEGRWNLSQDVIGIPRPLGARLVGRGIGADRYADWGAGIKFRERITEWQPGRVIGWRFIFDEIDGWQFTDRHLVPDSPYFKITTGGYRLEPVNARHTRVILETRYAIQTPVNAYSQLWGELFLGDLENNLLALIKSRAEAPSPRVASAAMTPR